MGEPMEIISIIPARGGSKGIPNKNLRLLNRKPLIAYAILNAKKSKFISEVVVSTDSKEIAYVAQEYGANVIMRDLSLSLDETTLDPVIFHAVNKILEHKRIDAVVTLQPTSPLLCVETLDAGIKYFLEGNWDTVISVVNSPRLLWEKKDAVFFPLYKLRLNRQILPPQYMETGAFLIAKTSVITNQSRIGPRISGYEISNDESVEIRDKNDWILAESLLGRKKIIFRVDGYVKLGMGHIYNCITMAYSMNMEHDVLLVLHRKSKEGIAKVKESNLPYALVENDEDLIRIISEFKPDIWVNDCLDTEIDYISWLKRNVPRVVTIEDLGAGALEADATINALYDDTYRVNAYSGYKYVCLREEFQLEQPGHFSEEVKNIIIMFGGTDPLNLNKRLYDIILKFSAKYKDIHFQFITGIGYDCEKNNVVTDEKKNIYVYPNVPRVSLYMKTADLAITSQGRTIFELAAMGVPAIVLSQNEREQTHHFAQMKNGFINLGIGSDVEQRVIENTLDWLIDTPAARKNMRELMLRYKLRDGVDRVKDIILGRRI